MLILFPSYPGDIKRPDPAFESEYLAAKENGFDVGIVDIEMMFGGAIKLNLPKHIPLPLETVEVMYRGWILKQGDYIKLDEQLVKRGFLLISSPRSYNLSMTFPSWYPLLDEQTPDSTWYQKDDGVPLVFITEDLSERFGDNPIIVKDYCKSRKQDWFDACFIRSAADKDESRRVIENFIRLQDDAFVGGLVFRKFIPLEQIGTHPKSKMPLSNEWRSFILDGEVLTTFPYWDGPEYACEKPVIVPPKLPVRFYTIDHARTQSGEWIVIEIGDGGSSGLPERVDPMAFYAAINKKG